MLPLTSVEAKYPEQAKSLGRCPGVRSGFGISE